MAAEILERGDIYFFYTPRVERQEVRGLHDVQRFYLVLSPEGRDGSQRRMVIGRKRLPAPVRSRQRFWAFVERVGEPEAITFELAESTYQTATRGERHQGPARPAGEGVYALARHDEHTHLAYALELPQTPGEVQDALQIRAQASYIVAVFNPWRSRPEAMETGEPALFSPELQEKFRGRRFAPVDPPGFLDVEGAELVLVGTNQNIWRELGIWLEPEIESAETADIFNQLKLARSRHPSQPLFDGRWK
jgi:hypothetical protein